MDNVTLIVMVVFMKKQYRANRPQGLPLEDSQSRFMKQWPTG